MSMAMYRLEKKPSAANSRAEEMLSETIKSANSALFALECTGEHLYARECVVEALEALQDARRYFRGEGRP